MHILPQLRKLELKFAESLFVIGVHSAKFDTERATENVRAAVNRYNVNHPVGERRRPAGHVILCRQSMANPDVHRSNRQGNR